MRLTKFPAFVRSFVVSLLPFVLVIPATLNAAEVAGRLQFVAGDVSVVKPDGSSRALVKGSEIVEGETIVTGREAQAQIVMADQALIAVRPDTRLKIEMFRYSGKDDENDRSFLGLLRGGFRAITGQIGRINRSGYQVRTPNATIGIRGTDHEPFYIPQSAPGEVPPGPPGTYDKVNSGGTVLQTQGGSIELGPNQVGFVSQVAGAAPVRLPEVPGFMRATSAPRAAGRVSRAGQIVGRASVLRVMAGRVTRHLRGRLPAVRSRRRQRGSHHQVVCRLPRRRPVACRRHLEEVVCRCNPRRRRRCRRQSRVRLIRSICRRG